MIRVFPRKTKWTPDDELAFIGHVPLFHPKEDMPVRVSVTFTQDIPEAQRLYKDWSQHYTNVQIGGPALGDPGGQFTPRLFIKEGVTITSRGCIRACPWCHVPEREGRVREYKVEPGHIIQDNNLLACSMGHIHRVFAMLKDQSRAAIFSGGLDTRLLVEGHIALLKSIRIKEMWFASDTLQSLDDLARASVLLKDFPLYKKRCYVLMGYENEPVEVARNRVESVLDMGFMPFAQFYQGGGAQEKTPEWAELIRKWSRPAAYMSKNKEII